MSLGAEKPMHGWISHVRLRLMWIYAAVAGVLFFACFTMTYCIVDHAVDRQVARELDRNRALFVDFYMNPKGERIAYMQHEFDDESREIGVKRLYLLLVDSAGKTLAVSPMPEELSNAMKRSLRSAEEVVDFHRKNGDKGRAAVCIQPLPDGNILLIGVERKWLDNRMEDLALLLLFCFFAVMVVALFAGFVFSPFVTSTAEVAFSELASTTDAIAHDLRTPVTHLRARAELAMMTGDSEEALAGDVAEECASMLKMIDMMLEIASTPTSIKSSPRENIDLRDIVKSALEIYSSVADDGGISLHAELPTVPISFSGHRSRLQQLVGNLLDNAIKFTPNGGSVSVRLESKGGSVEIAVIDTGCGIPPDDIPYVFDRFYRADRARTLPGNGLGLALVKAIATSYGGSVFAESAPGRGTTIKIRLVNAPQRLSGASMAMVKV